VTNTVVSKKLPPAVPWFTMDPFLFCVHHYDLYPAGNADMGPAASLKGRNIGMDFEGKDGWRMYHGDVVPGFPRHPHRGFETITIARQGFIDHSDSLGATARFGQGDVQWMTAGRGIVHSEMFPLVATEGSNPAELFQIWLNLPRSNKFAEPHFKMLWAPQIPKRLFADAAGRETEVVVVAGSIDDLRAPAPPPDSWAAQAESDVVIATLRMAPGARFRMPASRPGSNRVVYFFRGDAVSVGELSLTSSAAVQVSAEEVVIANGGGEAELLLLQGRPIAEPIAHYGPFVMNTPLEIQQAMMDYRRTEFGGWPWQSDGPVHPRGEGRFAIHADGRRETPPLS